LILIFNLCAGSVRKDNMQAEEAMGVEGVDVVDAPPSPPSFPYLQ
jgi:hypothetical protein